MTCSRCKQDSPTLILVHKRCPRCKQETPYTKQFWYLPRAEGRKPANYCKECMKELAKANYKNQYDPEYTKAYFQKNKARILETQRIRRRRKAKLRKESP